jgi:hypothetical protein
MMEIKSQFLEITAAVSYRALREMIEAAINQAFENPNIWIDQLHFFHGSVSPCTHQFHVILNVADIADSAGFFSNTVTDDQIKAMLLPVLGSMLEEQARKLVNQELWLRSVREVSINRMPRASQAAQRYLRWLTNLDNRPLRNGRNNSQ